MKTMYILTFHSTCETPKVFDSLLNLTNYLYKTNAELKLNDSSHFAITPVEYEGDKKDD